MSLLLTPDEIENLFKKLPEPIQEAWQPFLETETLTDRFETEAQIADKLVALGQEKSGVLEAYVAACEEAEKKGELPDVSPAIVGRLAEGVGAAGLSVMIVTALMADSLKEDDLDGLAAITQIRHRILAANPA